MLQVVFYNYVLQEIHSLFILVSREKTLCSPIVKCLTRTKLKKPNRLRETCNTNMYLPVLDQPVVLALIHSVPNNQDSVVKHDWIAGLLVIHPSLVQLERGLTGVNTYRDWTHTGHCFLKGQLVTSRYLDETRAGSPDFRRTKWAGFFLWTVHQALNRVLIIIIFH